MGCTCATCAQRAPRDTEYDAVRAALTHLVPLPEKPEHLGSGYYATVYATLDNRVVKITKDPSEPFAALLAMRSPQRHIVRVDHVFRFKGKAVIVAERLEPLPPGLKSTWKRVGDMHAVLWRGPLRPVGEGGLRLDWTDTERAVERLMRSPVAAGHLEAIVRDLLRAGITQCEDLHSSNVMVRPGTREIVASDLGLSRTASHPELPELPRPGVDDGDDGDVHRDPPPVAVKPDPRDEEIRRLRQALAEVQPMWRREFLGRFEAAKPGEIPQRIWDVDLPF